MIKYDLQNKFNKISKRNAMFNLSIVIILKSDTTKYLRYHVKEQNIIILNLSMGLGR